VRVGGGYLSIEEFVDQHAPAELERLGRPEKFTSQQERYLRHTSPGFGGGSRSPMRNFSTRNSIERGYNQMTQSNLSVRSGGGGTRPSPPTRKAQGQYEADKSDL